MFEMKATVMLNWCLATGHTSIFGEDLEAGRQGKTGN